MFATMPAGRPVTRAAGTLFMATSERLRVRRVQLERRATASRTVRSGLVSLAGLIGGTVTNQRGEEVGRLVDVVARLSGGDPYPPVTGLVVRVGRRHAFLTAESVAKVSATGVSLSTSRLDLREYARRPGEVLLARDVLDHQLVDVDGVQVTRAADLYLAPRVGRSVLVGVDVSLPTLLRRLGPRRWQARPTPERVLDWQAVAPFAEHATDGPPQVRLRASRAALHRLRPADLADLLEDLDRSERQQLLSWLGPDQAADALQEMEAPELESLLRETSPEHAARLVEEMEPDQAVAALRDLRTEERATLLARMPDRQAAVLRRLLEHRAGTAGGTMTTLLVTARREQSVGATRAELAARAEHRSAIDAVVAVDEAGRLVADVSLFDLTVADDSTLIGELADWLAQSGPPATVGPEARTEQVADELLAARASSVLVVDDEGRPLGRIMADDVLHTLLPERGRRHVRRFLP